MTLHKLTVKEIGAFIVEAIPEDMTPDQMEYNCEDFVTDVERMVDKFGDWGWCIVKVTSNWEGFEGTAYLGGCSYEGLVEFEKCGYYTVLLQESVDDLNNNIAKQYDTIKKLIE